MGGRVFNPPDSQSPARGLEIRAPKCPCGACATVCDRKALAIKGADMTLQHVLDEVIRDKHFYDASGGGVTLSGGEPMARFEFTKALLAECRRLKIHTALETCGFAPVERFDEIAPFTDLFLYDIKGVEPTKHLAHTGVSNDLILSNLRHLHDTGASIILRCPLVPGLNDSDEDLRALAELEQSLPRLLGVEIMPYHRMGVEKGRRVGMNIPLDAPSATAEQQAAWLEKLRSFGSISVSEQH